MSACKGASWCATPRRLDTAMLLRHNGDMKALIYHSFGAEPQLTTVADPVPTADGVVIKVEATGLCRSDWHAWMGHDADVRLPHVGGHELAGTVVDRGATVKDVPIGARVTVPFVCGCGQCAECGAGNQQVCGNQFQPGFTGWGSFAEYVAINQAAGNLVELPPEVSFRSAASLGCRFSTAFRAVVDQGEIRPGQWVAIHGCGGVGLSAIMIAKTAGARIIAVDKQPEARRRAKALGAEITLGSSSGTGVDAAVVEAIREHSAGGVHLSIDAFGHPDTCAQSVLSLRRRGTHVQVGLLLAEQSRPPLPMDRVIAHELRIIGSHGMQAHRYPALFALMASGLADPAQLIGRTITLDQLGSALMAMDRFEHSGITVVELE